MIQSVSEKLVPHLSTLLIVPVGGAIGLRFTEFLSLTIRLLSLQKGYNQTHDFCPTKNEQSVQKIGINAKILAFLEQFKIDQTNLLKKCRKFRLPPLFFITQKKESYQIIRRTSYSKTTVKN